MKNRFDLQRFACSMSSVKKQCNSLNMESVTELGKNLYDDVRTVKIDDIYHVKVLGECTRKGVFVVCPICYRIEHHGVKGEVKSNCYPRKNYIID